ncbi:virulence RhuM family protein [Rhodoferax sp.]|uniref:virulence RhuM family protein n=1 Tax=Rhodoferax sp. TaxID=50421 RepID=UPI0025FA4532|nr:virulence RhuM family protein [Rhodoferax sp.]
MSDVILYQTEDGLTRVQLRVLDGSVWLSQLEIAELFATSKQNVSLHIKNILNELELEPEATVKESLTVQTEGTRRIQRKTQLYNLPMILSVGYRVRGHRGTQFRQWATARLSDYLVKGFAMDDERLKNPPGPGHIDYFDELLARIRDIRSSERRFYQKVLDIYATSVDYAPDTALAQQFFATVQNKMHWATHGHTAAEIIHQRANAGQPQMGLQTTRPGGMVRKEDVSVAKNYLSADELQVLNRIVNLYIEYAELQALDRKPMRMQDWITKLDDFLKISGRELLDHAGQISAPSAKAKAELEYARYRQQQDALPRAVDADFERVAKALKALPPVKRNRKPS